MTRPGDLQSGVQKIKHATRELQRHWSDTLAEWDDATARQFAAKHLEPMLPVLRLIMAATSETDEVYRQAIQECDDPDRPSLTW